MSSSSRRSSVKRARDQPQQQQQQAEDESQQPHASPTAASSSPSPPTRRARLLRACADGAAAVTAAAEGQPADVDAGLSGDATAAPAREAYAAPSFGTSPPLADQRARRGAVAAASALALPSLAARLDLDSLSVVFSMLNTHGFLSAIRVCRQWRAARMRHTAWPELQLEPLIRSLQDDNYDPARRKLRLNIRGDNIADLCALLLGDGSAAPSSHAAGSGGVMWKHASEAHISCGKKSAFTSETNRRNACDAMLLRLSELPYLQAIKLDGFLPSSSLMEELFRACRDRLQAVQLYKCYNWVRHLPLLHHLRVLAVHGFVSASALLALPLLEYVRLDRSSRDPVDIGVGSALRRLATDHRLASVSLSYETRFALSRLLEPRATAPGIVDAGQLTSLSVDYIGDVDIMRSILALPSLTDLRTSVGFAHEALPLTSVAHLRQLHVRWSEMLQRILSWEHLVHMDQLRVLRLTFPQPRMYGEKTASWVPHMHQILFNNRATLEELRISSSRVLSDNSDGQWASDNAVAEVAADLGGWQVLSECEKLRVLELPLMCDNAPGRFTALSAAPAFQSLILTGVSRRLIPAELLQAMAASNSWRHLHLHGLRSLELAASDLHALLPASSVDVAAARRMRVHVYHGGSSTPDIVRHSCGQARSAELAISEVSCCLSVPLSSLILRRISSAKWTSRGSALFTSVHVNSASVSILHLQSFASLDAIVCTLNLHIHLCILPASLLGTHHSAASLCLQHPVSS